MIDANDVTDRYARYDHTRGITPQTHWIIGRRVLPRIRHLRDAGGHMLYADVVTLTTPHRTLMGLPFALSETDVDALYLED